jgi:hypothetical protein
MSDRMGEPQAFGFAAAAMQLGLFRLRVTLRLELS